MDRWYFSSASTQRSRYAFPASVTAYLLRAGPPSEVSHSDVHQPLRSILRKVRYSVPGFVASAPNRAERRINSYP